MNITDIKPEEIDAVAVHTARVLREVRAVLVLVVVLIGAVASLFGKTLSINTEQLILSDKVDAIVSPALPSQRSVLEPCVVK